MKNVELDQKNQIEHLLSGYQIPPCPESLTNILRAVNNQKLDLNTLAQKISQDAGIVGPLLKLANSPYVGLKNKATTVFQAVNVLGMQHTLNLIRNIFLKQSLERPHQSFEKFWERSSLCAAIAERLAGEISATSKNDAYLAGLFHDCGIPILIMRFPEYRDVVMSAAKQGENMCDAENATFSTCHTIVGNLMARQWMLSEDICRAILLHHDESIFVSQGQNQKNDILNLAGIIHLTEHIVNEYLNESGGQEWPRIERMVLSYFDLTYSDFNEIKSDLLVWLRDQ